MKILFLSDGFPPHIRGGAEVASFNLAQGLREKGHSVFVITATEDKDKVGESEYKGLKLFTLYSKYHPFFSSYFSLYNPQTVGKIKKIIKKISPDIVHAQNIHHDISFYSLKMAKKHSKGVFLTANDTMLFSYGKYDGFIDKKDLSVQCNFNYKVNMWKQFKIAGKRYNPFKNIMIRHYLKYVDKIFTITNVLKKALADNKITNVETIHYGTDMKPFVVMEDIEKFKNKYNLENKKIIFFGGRLGELKGGAMAVRILKYIVTKVPNAIILIAGTGSDYGEYMKHIAKDLGIENHLIFTGWINRTEMSVAYASCDVCITPSLYFDAFNLFNLEAMATGKPIVGTCFGGTPEVIEDGATGYVVNPFNINMMGDKIIGLLQDENKANKFGENGRKRAIEKFNMSLQVSKTLDWYNKVVN
ncbi:glycosyltransferase family 4 protein [Candidatus Pacearchaeota archaeon]|nr:glycosyltransferase family 4 protein [Candidatus Pacearchaeota archaeon]